MRNFWTTIVVAVLVLIGTFLGYMLTYNSGLAKEKAGPWFADTKVANDGWHSFLRAGCGNCHSILGQESQPTGPDLAYVGKSWSSDNIVTLLKNPRGMFPGTIMPSFNHLSDEELRTIADYLATLK